MPALNEPIRKLSPAAGAAIYVWRGHSFSTRVKAEAYRDRMLEQQAEHARLVALAAKLDS